MTEIWVPGECKKCHHWGKVTEVEDGWYFCLQCIIELQNAGENGN